MLILAALGTVLLYRRGRRAEALTIVGVCVCYVGYNSGYYLPFGGGFMGPRFMTTMLPFLVCPLGLALKRLPGPTVALAGVSVATTVIATITHPLVGYETETVVWARYLGEGFFQPTIASAYGLGRGWGGIWPFFLAAGGALVVAAWATPRLRLSVAQLGGRRARAGRLGAVRGARPHAARDRSPGAAQHRRGGRSHRAEPEAPRRQSLSAEDAGADRRGGRAAGPAGDGPATQPAKHRAHGARPARGRGAALDQPLFLASLAVHFTACSALQTTR